MIKKNIVLIILILISILSVIFVYNDDFIYKKEILKITSIKTINEDESTNSLGIKEKYYEKEITGTITNGKNKGTIKTINYEETYSSVITEKYKVGDKVFIDNFNIETLKRDTYIVFLIVFFIIAIYIVGKFRGLLSVISVIINCIIFYIGLILYFKGINILVICVIESIIFSFISLLIAGGINKKVLSAIISVITSIIIMLLLLIIISKITNYKGINFNEIAYLTVPYEDILLPELLIGTLGAIMDVGITMSSSISELIDKNNKISKKNLFKSSKEIGKDIMSTMCNVLFFTYICAGLPMFVLSLRNGVTMSNYISSNYSIEITRFLVGSIGIIMTIPISTFISIKILKRGKI